MNFTKHIPNAITCANLFCGCLAIVSAFKGDFVWTAYLVGIAAVLDFFDGFAARLLNAGGELGKQLDSMADMVTFGAVPGIVMYLFIRNALFNHFNTLYPFGDYPSSIAWMIDYLPLTGFIITIFSALRLAKFNIDTRQSESFIGLPTPANAILICSIPLILKQIHGEAMTNRWGAVTITNAINNNYVLLIVFSLLMSYLLVAEIPLFALKFKNFSWSANKLRYSFLIISVTLLILFQFIAIPFIIFLYIFLSIINNINVKSKTQ